MRYNITVNLFTILLFSLFVRGSYAQNKIQVALILDTSTSMDGLLHQTQNQIWNVVSDLGDYDKDSIPAIVEIALLEYGNVTLDKGKGFVKIAQPFTKKIDWVSKELYQLKPLGGEEYCPTAIQTAVRQLNWSQNPEDLRVLFIAGNETFVQGEVTYRDACQQAVDKNIIVNSIFCGNYDVGRKIWWEKAATVTGGEYTNLDQNKEAVFVPSPFDEKMESLNTQLNETFLFFGKHGEKEYKNMLDQDKNAIKTGLIGLHNRVLFKSKRAFKNKDWDLIDALTLDQIDLRTIDHSTLPKEIKGMEIDTLKVTIYQLADERNQIKMSIHKTEMERLDYLSSLKRRKNKDTSLTLEQVIYKIIHKQLDNKGFYKY